MPTRSDQDIDAGRRRERRRQRRNRHVRVQVPRVKRHGLRDQTATNVVDCFDVCNDQGFHFDPDIKIGSSLDPSYNPFSVLKVEQPSRSMQSESPRRPARSAFAFGALPAKSKPFSPPSLPPSIPTTPPPQPTVRLPGTHLAQRPTPPDSRRASISSDRTYQSAKESFLDHLAPVPDSFLYHKESREALTEIDDEDLDIARCLALAGGQEKPDPNFKSYNTDKTLTTATSDAHADAAAQPVVCDKQTFIGAALPDMSKAVPTQSFSRVLDSQFYKHTRTYLPSCGIDSEWPLAKICDSAFTNRDEELKALVHTQPTSNNSLEKRHPKLSLAYPPRVTEKDATPSSPHVELRATTTWTGEHRPTTTWLSEQRPTTKDGHRMSEAVVMRPPTSPESMRYELVFPKLAPSTTCEKSLISKEGILCDRSLERLVNLWGIADVDHSAPAKPVSVLHPDNAAKAMADFEKVMSPEDTSGAASVGLWVPSTGTRGLSTRTTSGEPISPHLRRRSRAPIYQAAVSAANASVKETNSAKTVDIAACPTPACTALVPAKLYQHQYLGWPAHFQYRDSSWNSLGAGITLKKSEQDFGDQTKRTSSIKKLVDGIAQDLGLDQSHEQGCCYANETDDAWSTEPAVCPEGSKMDETTSWPAAPWNGPDEETDGVDFGLELLFGEDKTYEGVNAHAGESLGCGPTVAPQAWEDAVEYVASPDEDEGYTSTESGWSDVKEEECWDTDEDWTDDEKFF